jgi:hypothetical protein
MSKKIQNLVAIVVDTLLDIKGIDNQICNLGDIEDRD